METVTVDKDGKIDFDDKSVTENTRVSYPINHIEKIVKPISAGPQLPAEKPAEAPKAEVKPEAPKAEHKAEAPKAEPAKKACWLKRLFGCK